MPACKTRYFNTVEYGEDSLIRFSSGLPGFEKERDFVFIEQQVHHPLLFLQSVATPGLCFIVLPVLTVDPDYKLHMRAEDIEYLGLETARQPRIGRDVFCGVILAVHEEEPTANLMAPLVIHLRTRTAVQAIQVDTGSSHCHSLVAREMVAC